MGTHPVPPMVLPGRVSPNLSPATAAFAPSLCIALVLALYWPTTRSMIEIWNRSETFQHCFLVVPIALWLIWNERYKLAATPVRPFWPALALLAGICAVWAFGALAHAQVVSHFAVFAMIGAMVLAVFGIAWVRVLWFPLLFLFFAVPFGEALVPKLMDWTADFTVAAVKLSGVPVYREGTHFVIPSGQWSVIEACSGIKFLIASLMGGSLYAWLMYRSPARRIAFIAASIVMPLLANWLRAYAIVMIGHLSNNRLMTNDDHIVFGWILFAAIMLATYWLGARWREDVHAAAPAASGAIARLGRAHAAAALAALAVAAVWPPLAAALMRPVGDAGVAMITTPAGQGDWQRQPGSLTTWSPELDGASSLQSWVFEARGQRVELQVAAFRHQTQAAQLGSSTNQLVRTTNLKWKQVAHGMTGTGGSGAGAVPTTVRAVEISAARGPERMLVWNWYYSRGRATTSDVDAKLDVAWSRLRREPDTALWITAATPLGTDREAAQRVLAAFVRDMEPALQQAFAESTRR